MVNIKTYRAYWEEMVNRIEELKASYLVANEAQLKDVAGNIDEYPILVATVPSANPDSRDSDNTAEINTGLLFVLKKVAASDRTDDTYLDDMELMQDILKDVKELMAADYEDCDVAGHAVMHSLQVNSFHQDPEYNYLGHDGWSLSFRFGSLGF